MRLITPDLCHDRRGKKPFLGAILLLLVQFASPLAWAQSNETIRRQPGDIVDQWSARVLAVAELKAQQAEHALQFVQQARQEKREGELGSLNSTVQASEFLPAYADVILCETNSRAHDSPREKLFRPALHQQPEPAVSLGLEWTRRKLDRVWAYAPFIRPALRAEGLPVELLAVPLVESGFDPMAESPKGAKGLWQLMPDTARRFGLNPEGLLDERVPPARSTAAAVRYLKELYEHFGDWPLALAAYNAGEGRIEKALAISPRRDFWTLAELGLIPVETRQYVPAVFRGGPPTAECVAIP